MPEAVISPAARYDLAIIWEVIARDNIDAADRVREAAFDAFEQLASMPEIGTKRSLRNPRLRNIRFWPIPHFRRYLIYYRPLGDSGVEIVRVLHGARDTMVLLEDLE